MPTDTSAGENGYSGHAEGPTTAPDDLTFAAHDLGRDRAPRAPEADHEVGFAQTGRPVAEPPAEHNDSFVATERPDPPPPPPPPRGLAAPRPVPPPIRAANDGFVIREPGAAPTAPVDALVVGAPLRAGDTTPLSPVSPGSFKITTISSVVSDPNAPPPWMVRTPEPSPKTSPVVARRGWATRPGNFTDGSAHAAMIRLREEAVQVSWKAAWIAVTAANPRLSRKRDA